MEAEAEAVGQVIIPDDPAPHGYITNPYESELAAAHEYLKRECDSTDGWSPIATKDGIVMEKKTIPGDSSYIPLVRGMGTVEGVKLADILPMLMHPGARKHWDPRFDQGHPLERYSRRAYMFYTLQKGAWLVQARDFVGAQDTFIESDGTYYLTQCSVPNTEKTPDAYGKTRGWLTAAGWRLRPSHDGNSTDVSYVVKVDPKGSLPTAIINMVVQEIPQCVPNVINFIRADGIIPYVSSPSYDSSEEPPTVFRMEHYSHDEGRKYTLQMIAPEGGEELVLSVDEKVKYKDGYEIHSVVEGEGDGDSDKWVGLEKHEGEGYVKLVLKPEAAGKKIDVIIQVAKRLDETVDEGAGGAPVAATSYSSWW
ncbi:Bet v1-like protein [Clavulina sp. PMI_390]|nr:Bet v1-like protein [Clavulina sp. PMI_390]